MRDDTVGVALVGFGFAGQTFHAPFISATPGMALRVVVSSQAERVRAEYPGARVVPTPDAALQAEDVDLVVIATPNEWHAPLAERALRAGRNVVVDKPFTVTLEEARDVVATAEASGRLVSVYQNRRFDADFRGLRAALAAGTIGEVVEVRSEIGRWRPQVRDRWRERPGPGAGLWYDLGPHLVDQAVAVFGTPLAVDAAIEATRPGATIDDWFHVRLEYPRCRVLVSSSMLAVEPVPRFVVRGTGGAIVKWGMDWQERRLMAGERPADADWGSDPEPLLVYRDGQDVERRPVPHGHYGDYYAAMRDAVLGRGPVPVTAREALTVMRIIAAGIDSARTGRCVDLTS